LVYPGKQSVYQPESVASPGIVSRTLLSPQVSGSDMVAGGCCRIYTQRSRCPEETALAEGKARVMGRGLVYGNIDGGSF
jgi:hypothetical protein